MNWSTSDRRERLPSNWASLRIRALRRDAYRCRAIDSQGRRCNAKANQVDHIEASGADDLDNLQSLCRWHHDRKSSAEGNAAKKPRATQRREPEAHPAFRR